MVADIVGTWKLVRTRATSTDGTPVPQPYGGSENAMGHLVLAATGRMMAVLCDGRPELPEGTAREYSSYCGNYSFDGTTLVTRVDAASDPARLGSKQVREVLMEGSEMVLRPPLRVYAGATIQREHYWQRVGDA